MKLPQLLLLGLSSFSLITINYFTPNTAFAQCVQADVGVQYNISGSTEPTKRTNDVDMESNGSCQGNVNLTTGVQGNVGGRNQVEQNRRVRNVISSGDTERNRGMKPVQIKTGVQVDVYNPADAL